MGQKQIVRVGITRPRFGFLTSMIHTGAGSEILAGVLEEAKRLDVDLYVYPGGRLADADPFEQRRNYIYTIASRASHDGILSWASSLGSLVGQEPVEAFHAPFRNKALVTISQRVHDAPVIALEAESGMEDILHHAVLQHGCKRFAYARGPKVHYAAELRYRAFQNLLPTLNLQFFEHLVSSPRIWERGSDAIRELCDQRGLVPGKDFDAIICASDVVATGVIRGLRERGYDVPADTLVFGFNDSREASLVTPGITTVSVPFRGQGASGLFTLYEVWRGAPVPEQPRMLPSRLIIRQSCGCPSDQMILAKAPSDVQTKRDGVFADRTEACIMGIAGYVGYDLKTADTWLPPLVHSLDQEVFGTGQGRFLRVFGGLLDRAVLSGKEIEIWHNAVSVLRREALPFADTMQRLVLEDLVGMARVMIGQASRRLSIFRLWEDEQLRDRLQALGRILQASFDLNRIQEALPEHLPGMGIASAYLVLHDRQASPFGAQLVLAFSEQGISNLPHDGLPFSCEHCLVPSQYLPRRRVSFVVEPLYVRDEDLGYILLEVGPSAGLFYEDLRSVISGAIKGALLTRGIEHVAPPEPERAAPYYSHTRHNHPGQKTTATPVQPERDACTDKGNVVLVIDPDVENRTWLRQVLSSNLPEYQLVGQNRATEALSCMENQAPALVILELGLPDQDGEAFLAMLRSTPGWGQVPIMVLTDRLPDEGGLRFINDTPRVLLLCKGILMEEEFASLVQKFIKEPGGSSSRVVVQRAAVWIARHSGQQFSRWQLAEELSVSEDHLGRLFNAEVGISPWVFLNRYRVHQACRLLERTNEPVAIIAAQAGFQDASYFGRVFRKITGLNPLQYRNKTH